MPRQSQLSLVTVALLISCFDSDTTGVPVKCDEANPCPSTSECKAGICEAASPVDMSASDGATQPDMTMSGPCKNGSEQVLGTAVACEGLGKWQDVCGIDYQVCKDTTGLSVTTCNLLPGFFVADVPGYFTGVNRSSPSCGASVLNPLFYGCGTKARTYVAETPANQCSGFNRNLECGGARPWQCSNTNIDTLSNTAAGDGYLCCKKPM